ncbi:coiled-coil domain-containing protein 110 [Pseudorasbora parva]|uniref:coiled-coil domain-containing protein 110 n=1 Tax=Pseudorasbora parva TaxID=51549 RepID=UPI00351F0690
MEKCRYSDSSLSCGLNSDPAMQVSESGGGDNTNVMDSESKATTDLEDTVRKLSKVMVPLEEDNLILSKKENKAMKPEAGCKDFAAKPTRQCPFEVYLEKCTQLEKENLEVKKKLKKTAKYSNECKTELQIRIFVKRFKEFKNVNKDLDSKNKHLLIKNQQMRQRITEVLKQNRPQSEDPPRVTKCCEHYCQQNQKMRPDPHSIVHQEGEQNLTEPVESQRMKQDSEITQLQQENQTLRESLDHNSQVIKDAESRAERVQQELDELDSCLLTVQTERDLLRQEVKRLHKEYISLTNSISLQLKENNKASGLKRFSGKPLESNALLSITTKSTSLGSCGRHSITDKGGI